MDDRETIKREEAHAEKRRRSETREEVFLTKYDNGYKGALREACWTIEGLMDAINQIKSLTADDRIIPICNEALEE